MREIFKHKNGQLLEKIKNHGKVSVFFKLDSELNKIPSMHKNGFQEIDVKGNLYFERSVCHNENVKLIDIQGSFQIHD